MLTLEEFTNTCIKTNINEGARQLLIPVETFDDDLAMFIFEEGCFFSQQSDGQYGLWVHHESWISSDFDYIVSKLYFEHYVWECQELTLDHLTATYNEYLNANGLETGCALEHLMGSDLTQEQREWLSGFVAKWDEIADAPAVEIKETLTHNNIDSWMETVWDLLHDAREKLIPEGDKANDDRWDDVATAMAWIEEELKG